MTSKSNAVVVCDDISKTFRRKSGNVLALDSVSLSISPSEFVAIRGKSGCGKSTLMLCLGGLQKPDEGQVVIHGQAIYIDPAAEMVIARFATFPISFNAAIDPTSLPAYQAVADYLINKSQ